ncbi:glycine/betaine ABC transporter substrate-binding protein [Anoxybacillus sp. LAT_35]|uniref:glycine/betaine ABC transporter substrate-binding protein n=1 Tax=unclassified Anoxybacillus TaxID=2639704 RepID=UPI001EDC47FE|nr:MULTISPECIES: glycine/betaine ABC transporter substrate-binding protein [unclassified Anoxybacillus]MCG5026271.1 glycine/betaine ABC transporter substrate-binding protein [Anoxybacillus flavithermus]MCG6196574.1 glycine/betaine ABC transporter substrate-binding protein [Anoxybacillus sp. LAT_38]MCG3084270.1 glycine/betaine ABC transporter substrate-binding protein [Anoxybacillus sp. LAT27]MCG6172323.1 glycine/betaine ABC transporter substrate-binding protein [Anoxybacillus sp. LAT_11]MCG617
MGKGKWIALAGIALLLANNKTRQVIKETCREWMDSVEQVKGTVHQTRQHVDEMMNDLQFIVNKLSEVKETTPQVMEWIGELIRKRST